MLSHNYLNLSKLLEVEYKVHLDTKSKLLSSNKGEYESELKYYQAATRYAAETFNAQDIITWSVDQLLVFLSTVHQIVARSLYEKKQYPQKSGEYRNDIGMVMRHAKANAYTAADYYGRKFLAIEKDYGKKTALSFLIAYYKIITVPSKNVEAITKFKLQLDVIAKQRDITYQKSELEGELTKQQQEAFNLVYKIFIPHEQIPQAMRQVATDFLAEVKSDKINPIKIYANYFLKFINIHPWQDGNGRVIMLLMNAVLWRKNFLPVLLIDNQARMKAEHLYGADPDPQQLENFLQSRVKTFTPMVPPNFIFHLQHSQEMNEKIAKNIFVIENKPKLISDDDEFVMPNLVRKNTRLLSWFSREAVTPLISSEKIALDSRLDFCPKKTL